MDAVTPINDNQAVSRIDRLEFQVAALSASKRETASIWSPSVMIAMAAFAISLITTGFSAYRTYKQDIDSRKQQLATVIQSIANLAIQSSDMFMKYKNDPALVDVRGAVTQQSNMLVKQAYSLIRSLGSEASALDLINVAYLLSTMMNEVGLSDELLIRALPLAQNSTEYVAASRQLGQQKIFTGQVEDGNRYFQQALDVFEKFPKEANNQPYVLFTHGYTEHMW